MFFQRIGIVSAHTYAGTIHAVCVFCVGLNIDRVMLLLPLTLVLGVLLELRWRGDVQTDVLLIFRLTVAVCGYLVVCV